LRCDGTELVGEMNLKKQSKNKLANMKVFPTKLSILLRFKFINNCNLCKNVFKYLNKVIFKEMQSDKAGILKFYWIA
jgi:hypothetical protein